MTACVIVTTRLEALHHWPTIPTNHPSQYLRYPHRHEFHIKVWLRVDHEDREIEFIDYRHELDTFLKLFRKDEISGLCDIGSMSCESLAKLILSWFPKTAIAVEVLEDGDMGAVVYVDPQPRPPDAV